MIQALSLQFHTPRERIIACLISSIFLLFGLYVYFMNVTVRNVAFRQELEVTARSLVSDVSSLEFAYMDLKNDITLADAHAFGFTEAGNVKVVTRGTLAPNISAALQ